MVTSQLLSIDLQEPTSSLQIFPRSPVQISDLSAWQGIFLAHHRQSAWEMPEDYLAQCILSINIGSARKLERLIEGKVQPEQFLLCNIAIYPAKVTKTA